MGIDQLKEMHEPLETATELERAGIIKKSCAYKLAKQGVLPCYLVGPKQTGVRFRRSEVLLALRRPATSEAGSHDR